MPVLTCSQRYGGHGERETPGLIPNPEAKPLSADGTAPETGWESRTPPDNHSRKGAPASVPGPLSGVAGTARPLPLFDFGVVNAGRRRTYPGIGWPEVTSSRSPAAARADQARRRGGSRPTRRES